MPLLTLHLASLVTAVIVHAVISALDAFGMSGDTYGLRAHDTFAPAVSLVAAVVVVLCLRVALRTVNGARHDDPFVAFLERFEHASPWRAVPATATLGLALLGAMEATEQLLEAGRFIGVTDALGGHPGVALLTVAFAASLVVAGGLRVLRWLLAGTAALVRVVCVWLRSAFDSRATNTCKRSCGVHLAILSCAMIALCFGLRAPPRIAFFR